MGVLYDEGERSTPQTVLPLKQTSNSGAVTAEAGAVAPLTPTGEFFTKLGEGLLNLGVAHEEWAAAHPVEAAIEKVEILALDAELEAKRIAQELESQKASFWDKNITQRLEGAKEWLSDIPAKVSSSTPPGRLWGQSGDWLDPYLKMGGTILSGVGEAVVSPWVSTAKAWTRGEPIPMGEWYNALTSIATVPVKAEASFLGSVAGDWLNWKGGEQFFSGIGKAVEAGEQKVQDTISNLPGAKELSDVTATFTGLAGIAGAGAAAAGVGPSAWPLTAGIGGWLGMQGVRGGLADIKNALKDQGDNTTIVYVPDPNSGDNTKDPPPPPVVNIYGPKPNSGAGGGGAPIVSRKKKKKKKPGRTGGPLRRSDRIIRSVKSSAVPSPNQSMEGGKRAE